jgi:DDE superfamily endonuclease
VKVLRPTHPSANTKMLRLYGRCVRGERLVDHQPQGHWKTITFVAALRQNGMTAPCTIDGAMNGRRFVAYVERCLAPTLKRNDIVMIAANPQAERHRDDRRAPGPAE